MDFNTSHLEPFYGNEFDPDKIEAVTIARFNKKDLARESSLMESKWHDYRVLKPLTATYYFYHHYVIGYQRFWRKCMNHESAAYAFPFKGEAKHDFIKAKEAPSIWRLRQCADMMGIRYDFFARMAFDMIYKMQANGKIYAPRPAMLMKQEFLEAIHEKWLEHCKATLQTTCHPMFNIENYSQADDIHRSYEQYLIGQINDRRNPHFSIAYLVYDLRQLREEKALEVFGEEILSKAKEHAEV